MYLCKILSGEPQQKEEQGKITVSCCSLHHLGEYRGGGGGVCMHGVCACVCVCLCVCVHVLCTEWLVANVQLRDKIGIRLI